MGAKVQVVLSIHFLWFSVLPAVRLQGLGLEAVDVELGCEGPCGLAASSRNQDREGPYMLRNICIILSIETFEALSRGFPTSSGPLFGAPTARKIVYHGAYLQHLLAVFTFLELPKTLNPKLRTP